MQHQLRNALPLAPALPTSLWPSGAWPRSPGRKQSGAFQVSPTSLAASERPPGCPHLCRQLPAALTSTLTSQGSRKTTHMAAGPLSNSVSETKPALSTTQHLRPHNRGSWKAQAPSPSGLRGGAATPASGTAWPLAGRRLRGSAPQSFLVSLSHPGCAATLHLARCCAPGVSLLNEGPCVESCGLAGPGGPSCSLSP